MASNFPTSLDVYATLVDNVDDVLAAHSNDRGDGIENLQIKVGINSSAVVTSIDYFLKHASGAYRTHFHDGSSDDGATLDWDTCWSDAVHDHTSSAEGGVIFVSGDWILSTVTTARTGWTNVSATYSNKFMRINATPLTTGGADTHTTPSHVLTQSEMPAHTHGMIYGYEGAGATQVDLNADGNNVAGTSYTNSSGGDGGHTHSSADNVPAYVQVVVFQKD